MQSVTADPAEELWRTLGSMRRQLELTLERRLQADAGISTADFEILNALHDVAGNRLRAGQIAELIGWEKSRVSHQIQRMEQRDLIGRAECGDDARGIWVTLTSNGEQAFASARGDRSEAVRQHFFDVLSESEKAMLQSLSQRVLATMAPTDCDPRERV